MKAIIIVAALAAMPAVAHAQDSAPAAETTNARAHDGVRIEARVGYETPTVSDSGNVYKIGSAVSYGGEVGFDVALGRSVVAGPYAVYEFSSVKLCDGPDCLSEKGNLGVGGRIGVAVSDRALIYAKAGYANIDFKANTAFGTGSTTKDGVQGAIGASYNFTKTVYGGIEINYADYGKFFGVNLQRRHVVAALGVRF